MTIPTTNFHKFSSLVIYRPAIFLNKLLTRQLREHDMKFLSLPIMFLTAALPTSAHADQWLCDIVGIEGKGTGQTQADAEKNARANCESKLSAEQNHSPCKDNKADCHKISQSMSDFCTNYASNVQSFEKKNHVDGCFSDWTVHSIDQNYGWCMSVSHDKAQQHLNDIEVMLSNCNFCQKIAQAVTSHEQENKNRGCYSDWVVHTVQQNYGSCMSMSHDKAQQHLNDIEVMLSNCNFCQKIAQAVTSHEQENKNRGCYSDWAVHTVQQNYGWCMSVSHDKAQQHLNDVEVMLSACKK